MIRTFFTSRAINGIGKNVWNGQTEPVGGTRKSRQPQQFAIVPYVGTRLIGGFDIDVAYQIIDLGNIAVHRYAER